MVLVSNVVRSVTDRRSASYRVRSYTGTACRHGQNSSIMTSSSADEARAADGPTAWLQAGNLSLDRSCAISLSPRDVEAQSVKIEILAGTSLCRLGPGGEVQPRGTGSMSSGTMMWSKSVVASYITGRLA